MVSSVGEYGDAREDVLKESEEWAGAWNDIAPDWAPTSSNTRAAFNGLLDTARSENSELSAKKVAARRADLNEVLAQLQEACVAWYGQATRVFAAGTPSGDLIRGQIPTFSDAGTPTPPAPAPTPPAG